MANIKFGTDGWRGVIAWDFTFDNIKRMAQALATFINTNMPSNLEDKTGGVVVGYDRRFMADRVAADIATIMELNKLDVTLLDKPVSTPMISCLSFTKYWFAIMVTASHNDAQYLGIKIKMNGGSVPLRFTKEIEELINQRPALYTPGYKPETKSGLEKIYFKYVSSKANLKKALTLKGKVAVDYMYGSACGYLENLLTPKKVIALHTEHDPTFGGVKPEPKESVLTELKKTVVEKKCLFGIAFDGDGDRSALINEKGKYVNPMQVSAVLLHHLVKYKKLKGNVLQCLSMGYLTKRIAREYGLEFEELPVGFKHIAERTYLEDVLFGAEESGGYCWKGTMPERDGLLLAIFIMEIMATRKMKLSDLVKETETLYGKSYYERKDVDVRKIFDGNTFGDKFRRKLPKKILGKEITEYLNIDGMKLIFSDDSWLLARPSGTEPVIRLYAEASEKKQTQALLELAENALMTLK
ncbi:MAG: hypothetical protein K6E94_07330 [Elusimicrobiaceae bacterium]|nr:hypothetical protein [Elusimicrobiaceae bacterium]